MSAVIVITSDDIDFKGEMNEDKHQLQNVQGDKSETKQYNTLL